MNIFFKSILSLSLSGTLLIILMFLCKPLLWNRISKRWQYYMWVVVIVRLLVPFTLPVSPVNALFQKVDRAMMQMTVNLTENDYHALQEELAVVLQNLWLVWLIGALLLLIRKITIYQSFVKYVRVGCLEESDIDLLNRLAQYEEQIGVKTPVELWVNNLISSPMLIGFLKPCIVLPTTDLSDSDLRYTILHELSHYKYRDMFYKWIVQITLCLHWFNPFVYLMCNEINRACELACDETIISRLDTKEQKAYGDTLLNAMEAGGIYGNLLASMTLYENKEMIKERLDAINNFKKKSVGVTLGSIALVIGLTFVSTVIGAYAMPSITGDESAADAALSIAEDESVANTAASITEDEQRKPEYGETIYVVDYPKNTTENSITVNVIRLTEEGR